MIGTVWRRHRAATLLGLFGAALLGLMLAFFVLLIAGMSHCSECDLTPSLLRGFGFSLVVASLFGLGVGFAAAGLRPMLRRFLGAGGATALLVLLTFGAALVAVPFGIVAVQLLEHRIERWKEDARIAELTELCPDRSRHLAIIHDALPRPLPRYTFVARVKFSETDVTPLYQGGARARVTEVIQGDPAIRDLVVERVQSDRCDKAFVNGDEGLVVLIPKDRPRGTRQKVEAIFVRREDGFRLPDGFRIEEWQRPYWLVPPRRFDPAGAPRSRSVTQAENGIASTSIDGGEAIVVQTAPPSNVVEARGAAER